MQPGAKGAGEGGGGDQVHGGAAGAVLPLPGLAVRGGPAARPAVPPAARGGVPGHREDRHQVRGDRGVRGRGGEEVHGGGQGPVLRGEGAGVQAGGAEGVRDCLHREV